MTVLVEETVEPDPDALAATYGLTISGARPSLAAYTRELWERRHFIAAFATARLTVAYTTARLGQLWQVITPLLNAGVYFLIFGMLLKVDRGIDNFIPYLCTGVFVFGFTQSAVLAGTRSIQDNLSLIRAMSFPRACLPLATTLLQLQQLLFSLGVLMVIVVACGEPLRPRMLLAVPALALQSGFNAGLALVMARIGAEVTDASQLMPFVLRTWLYFSGVFYNIQKFTEHAPAIVGTLLDINPGAVYIDLMRYSLMDSMTATELPPHVWAVALGWALFTGIAGFVFFWRAEQEYGRG